MDLQSEEHRFHHQLRVRACGVLRQGNELLCIQLFSPVTQRPVWTFPGGGVELGESLQETVIREFKEETGLDVSVQSLLYVHELIESPFHAIEFYFEVALKDTHLPSEPIMPQLGHDPENDSAYLLDLKFLHKDQLNELKCSPTFFVERYWQMPPHRTHIFDGLN
jgi:8-oxo-dGTP diphosphatase